MTALHPALPETYVVEVNPQASEGFTRTPVLAWLVEDKRPLPVTLHGKMTLIGGDTAVEFPGGMVHHPSEVLAFDTVEAWLESNPGKAKSHPKTVTKVTPSEESAAPGGESAYDIEWLGKPFKSNSFWHYDDGEYEFVFVVEPGSDIPKASAKCAKIKRDDNMAMKKNIDALSVEDILGAEPIELADEGEDDDDDGDDLI